MADLAESGQAGELIKAVSDLIYGVMRAYVDETEFGDAELDECITPEEICSVVSARVVEEIRASRA